MFAAGDVEEKDIAEEDEDEEVEEDEDDETNDAPAEWLFCCICGVV